MNPGDRVRIKDVDLVYGGREGVVLKRDVDEWDVRVRFNEDDERGVGFDTEELEVIA